MHHKSHKSMFGLLDLYYTSKFLMASCCVSAEIFLLCIYLQHFGQVKEQAFIGWVTGSWLFTVVWYYTGFFYCVKGVSLFAY